MSAKMIPSRTLLIAVVRHQRMKRTAPLSPSSTIGAEIDPP